MSRNSETVKVLGCRVIIERKYDEPINENTALTISNTETVGLLAEEIKNLAETFNSISCKLLNPPTLEKDKRIVKTQLKTMSILSATTGVIYRLVDQIIEVTERLSRLDSSNEEFSAFKNIKYEKLEMIT